MIRFQKIIDIILVISPGFSRSETIWIMVTDQHNDCVIRYTCFLQSVHKDSHGILQLHLIADIVFCRFLILVTQDRVDLIIIQAHERAALLIRRMAAQRHIINIERLLIDIQIDRCAHHHRIRRIMCTGQFSHSGLIRDPLIVP